MTSNQPQTLEEILKGWRTSRMPNVVFDLTEAKQAIIDWAIEIVESAQGNPLDDISVGEIVAKFKEAK